MTDLLCLVADKNMEAAVQGLLGRPQSFGIRSVTYDVYVHPRRDPGCFHEAAAFLKPYRGSHDHALVMLDLAWHGAPERAAEPLRELLDESLRREGLAGWAEVVVIDPELEAWAFANSPQVDVCLGWSGRQPNLRDWLESCHLWVSGEEKPADPKAAVEKALFEVRKPRSSSIYRELATKVTVGKCSDPAFFRFRMLLESWFRAARSP